MFYSSTFRTLESPLVLHYHQFHICYLFPCQGKIFIGVNCDTKKSLRKLLNYQASTQVKREPTSALAKVP